VNSPTASGSCRPLVVFGRRLPPRLIEDAKTLVLDYLGVGLAAVGPTAAGSPPGLPPNGRGGEATIIGDGRGAGVHAAFANAIASHSVELTTSMLALHFSPPVVSSALAVAERANRRAAWTSSTRSSPAAR
jgi:2-methylcitrate dehydratase PrpD